MSSHDPRTSFIFGKPTLRQGWAKLLATDGYRQDNHGSTILMRVLQHNHTWQLKLAPSQIMELAAKSNLRARDVQGRDALSHLMDNWNQERHKLTSEDILKVALGSDLHSKDNKGHMGLGCLLQKQKHIKLNPGALCQVILHALKKMSKKKRQGTIFKILHNNKTQALNLGGEQIMELARQGTHKVQALALWAPEQAGLQAMGQANKTHASPWRAANTLMAAIYYYHREGLLLDKEQFVTLGKWCGLKGVTEDSDTALHLACRHTPEAVVPLLELGASLECANNQGQKPLNQDTPGESRAVVEKWLLEKQWGGQGLPGLKDSHKKEKIKIL